MSFLASSSSTYLRLCILSAFGIFALNANAATTNVNSINEEQLPQVELDEIVVTATRTPTRTSNVIAQTRVINSEELQRYKGQTVIEVLKRQPGFSIKQDGSLGSNSNFYMRGYDNKQILVLIDGIRYSSVSTGAAALNLLPAEQINRIELLYGASGSSIYGADAMGGVIQVFTKGSTVERSNVSVTAGIGSNDQYLYGASAQLANDKGTTLSLSATHNETNGFNSVDRSSAGGMFSIFNADDDGFESNNFSLAVNQRINDQLLAGASLLYSDSTTEFDDGALEEVRSEQENGAAQAYVDWRYSPDSSVKLQYGHSIDKSDTFSNFSSNFETKQDQISLVGKQNLPVGQAVYGLEYLNQSLDSDVPNYDIDDRDVTSAFLGYVLANDQFDAQANLRYDDNSQYGDETTYNLGAAYHLSPNLRAGVGYAKGFRAPTFNDLFPGYGGNPNLKPETSDNYEAFIEYDTILQSTRVTGYYNKVDNLIAYVPNPTADNPFAGSSENVNQSKIKGATLTSDWVVDNYLFGASYDYQQAEDDSGGVNDGELLPFRPEHTGLVYLGYRLADLDIRTEVEYGGERNNASNEIIDDYTLLNISGSYNLTPNAILTSRVNNITNVKYTTNEGFGTRYDTDGINFFTSLTYNWY